MTKKYLKYPVMGKVTVDELRDLAENWDIDYLYKMINGLNVDIEHLDNLLLSIIEQKRIIMKVLKRKEAKKYEYR